MEKSIKDMTEEIVKIYSDYDKTKTNSWNYRIASHDLSCQEPLITDWWHV